MPARDYIPKTTHRHEVSIDLTPLINTGRKPILSVIRPSGRCRPQPNEHCGVHQEMTTGGRERPAPFLSQPVHIEGELARRREPDKDRDLRDARSWGSSPLPSEKPNACREYI